jgi:hypothetical protein
MMAVMLRTRFLSPYMAKIILRSVKLNQHWKIVFFVHCPCIAAAFTLYQEAYAMSMNSGQQSDVCWLLENALLVCVSSALLAFGCERVKGPILRDMPHESDAQYVYTTVISLGENSMQPWHIHAADEHTMTSKGRSAEGVKYL